MGAEQLELDDLAWLSTDARALLRASSHVVPFVGAGISRAAHLPAAHDLAVWIRSQPEVEPLHLGDVSLFQTVDEAIAAGVISEGELVSRVCAELDISHKPYELAETHLALGRVASGVVVTFNYDLLIEKSSEEQGIKARTLTLEAVDLPEATDAVAGRIDDDVMRVIHVHGSVIDPTGIVLTAASYRGQREEIRQLLTLLYKHRTICFLGTALDEVYLLSELELLRQMVTSPSHVLVTDVENAEKLMERAAVSKHRHGVLVEAFETGRWATLDSFVPLLSRAPIAPARVVVAPATRMPVDDRYITNTLVVLIDGDDDEVAESLLAEAGLRHKLDETDLASFGRRTVIVGAPGSGKSSLLRRVGVETSETEHPVLLSVAELRTVGTAAELLAEWSRHGESLRDEQPVGQDALRDLRFHFLLDGLDEAPLERQTPVAQAIVKVADAFPQHRFTVATRPVPAVDAFEGEEWGKLGLRPGFEWRQRFLAAEGIDFREMIDSVAGLRDVQDLLRLPFFLRAAVDLWRSGNLEGVEGIAGFLDRLIDQAITSEALDIPSEALRLWLRKIAFAMQVAGRVALSQDELSQIEMPAALAERGAFADILERLLATPLLQHTSVGYRFVHRLIGERLVAEELQTIGPVEEALNVVAPQATEVIRGLNRAWAVPTVLAAVDSRDWRTRLAARDELAGALATPTGASREERVNAGQLIWRTYASWEIWLFNPHEFDLLEAGDVLVRLIGVGDLPELVDEIVAAVDDGSPYRRGNAIQLIGRAHLGDRIGDERLAEFITGDENTVVRRMAVGAAMHLRRRDLLPVIVDRLAEATDSVEKQDLALAASELASDDELPAIALRHAGDTDMIHLRLAARDRLSTADRLSVLRAQAEREAQPIQSERSQFVELLQKTDLDTLDEGAVGKIAFIAIVWRIYDPHVFDAIRRHPQAGMWGLLEAVLSDDTIVYEHDLVGFAECLDVDLLREAGVADHVIGWIEQRQSQGSAL